MASPREDGMPMAEVDLADGPVTEALAELLVVPAWSVGDARATAHADAQPPVLGPGADDVARALDLDLATELHAAGFSGAAGEALRVPTRGVVPAAAVLVVGLGPRDAAAPDALRRAAAVAANAAERSDTVATTLPAANPHDDDPAAAVQAVVEGWHLGAYRFGAYKRDAREHEVRRLALHVPGGADRDGLRAGLRDGQAVAAATALVRDLVNTPSDDKRPPALAERVAHDLASDALAVRILAEDELGSGGYGGILGVGAGSTAPPRLVEMTYAPDGATRHVALVGKGITFDSGGLSLKTVEGMATMKTDMAGAATVAATVAAAAALSLPLRVTGLLALAENMPSGSATRLGDVLTMRGGTTVEVLNTDAEGRLVLADALVHASEGHPDAIVDVATLTGAAVVALGKKIGVLMASDDGLAAALTAAAEAAGEPLWRLPLGSDQYRDVLDSDVADLRNAGWGRDAGTVLAGLFLAQFVGPGIPWAHLDIAGVSRADEADAYGRKGATGVPTGTLVRWLRAVAAAG